MPSSTPTEAHEPKWQTLLAHLTEIGDTVTIPGFIPLLVEDLLYDNERGVLEVYSPTHVVDVDYNTPVRIYR